jgi:hypothetical protein
MIENYLVDILVAGFLACTAFFAYRYKFRKDANKKYLNVNSELKVNIISGPKGWILLFQLLLIFNAIVGGMPLFGLIHDIKSNIENISDVADWRPYVNFSYAFVVTNFALSIYIVYRLQKVFVRATVNLVFLFIFLLIFIEFINLFLFFTSDFFKIYLSGKVHPADGLIKLVVSFIFVKLPWLIYFIKSKRVRNTYL